MKRKKHTFWRNLLALFIKGERWKADPRNAELLISEIQRQHNID